MTKSTLLQGDCLLEIKKLSDESVDSIVTDPPYELGFMGKSWDSTGIAYNVELWKDCLRVLKPGGNLLAFSGTRTYHRMTVAIEDAGFEIRDQIGWLYGTGMPKGLNVSKAIKKHDETLIAESEEWEGWNTSLRPSWEPICFARKPLIGTVAENVLKYGTGGINIDASRIPVDLSVDDPRLGGNGTWKTENMAKNVYGDYKGDEVGSSPLGRWPANIIHDGSEEVETAFSKIGEKTSGKPGKRQKNHETGSMSGTLGMLDREEIGYGDKGSVSRFFYSSKASKDDRAGSKHPTVKPVSLMRYLVKMVTPPNGTVLDPFGGSGTTGQAALEEGFNVILIENDAEYCIDIQNRLDTFHSKNKVFNTLFT